MVASTTWKCATLGTIERVAELSDRHDVRRPSQQFSTENDITDTLFNVLYTLKSGLHGIESIKRVKGTRNQFVLVMQINMRKSAALQISSDFVHKVMHHFSTDSKPALKLQTEPKHRDDQHIVAAMAVYGD